MCCLHPLYPRTGCEPADFAVAPSPLQSSSKRNICVNAREETAAGGGEGVSSQPPLHALVLSLNSYIRMRSGLGIVPDTRSAFIKEVLYTARVNT